MDERIVAAIRTNLSAVDIEKLSTFQMRFMLRVIRDLVGCEKATNDDDKK